MKCAKEKEFGLIELIKQLFLAKNLNSVGLPTGHENSE